MTVTLASLKCISFCMANAQRCGSIIILQFTTNKEHSPIIHINNIKRNPCNTAKKIVKLTNLLVSTVARNGGNWIIILIGRLGCYD